MQALFAGNKFFMYLIIHLPTVRKFLNFHRLVPKKLDTELNAGPHFDQVALNSLILSSHDLNEGNWTFSFVMAVSCRMSSKCTLLSVSDLRLIAHKLQI